MKQLLFILTTLFVFGWQAVNAQEKPIKIVTGHPDFKMKVTRCASSGKTVVLDMVITNLSDNDIDDFRVHGSSYATKVYDDQGNIYENDISVKIANKEYTTGCHAIKLVSGVPFKFSIMIPNVSIQAETLVLVEPDVYCTAWKITKDVVKLRNIPITRD